MVTLFAKVRVQIGRIIVHMMMGVGNPLRTIAIVAAHLTVRATY